MRNTFFTIIFSLFLFQTVFAQEISNSIKTIPELTTPNPDTYNLGQYGEVPVNTYSGIANIVVPLYSIDFDGLEIPINLTYNTSTPRAAQEGSWIGLGWTLSCEPVITRQIKGLCDISNLTNSSNSARGYPYTNIELPSYGGSIPDNLYNMLDIYLYPYVVESGWDTEPDIFSANIFGETISFIFTQKAFNNNQIGIKLINGDKRYKVEYDEINKNFTLTNPFGFKFYFTEKESSIVAPGNDSQGYNSTAQTLELITGWKLSKIVSPYNRNLVFTYGKLVTQSQPRHSNYQFVNNTADLGGLLPSDMKTQSFTRSSYLQGFKSIYLKEINTDYCKIEFFTSDRIDISALGSDVIEVTNLGNIIGFSPQKAQKLDNIIIKASDGTIVKNYKLNNSYFNSDQIGKQSNAQLKRILRLKLDRIDLNNILYRQFSYIDSNNLPDKTSGYEDFWGFYNGKTNHTWKLFPTFSKTVNIEGKYVTLSAIGDNRFPDFNYSKAGLLNKIIYPTGGYTNLEYEANNIKIDENNYQDFTSLGYQTFKEFSTESQSVDYPKETEVFEILEDSPVNAVIDIQFGINGNYILDQQSSNIKYTVEEKDKINTAYQLVDVTTNKVIDESYFTSGGCYTCDPLKPSSGTNWNKITKSMKLPKGKYKIRAKALKHISNFFDANDGAPANHADFGKQYNYMVKVTAKIPLLAFSKDYNLEAGGGRIKSITNYDKNNSLLTKKEYRYLLDNAKNSTTSSGILIDKLLFFDFKRISYYAEFLTSFPHNVQYISESVYTMTVYSDNIAESRSSTHIGYSRVEEIQIDNQNLSNNGSRVSEFINVPNTYGYFPKGNCLTVPTTDLINRSESYSLIPTHSFDEINGKISKETLYDNKGIRIKEILYAYNSPSTETPNISHPSTISTGIKQYIRKMYNSPNLSNTSVSQGLIYIMQIYKIISENIQLISKTEIDYLDEIPVWKTIAYEYNNSYQPSIVKESTSAIGINKDTYYKYPNDFNTTSPYKEMIERNIIDPVIQTNIKNNKAESISQVNFTNSQSITNGLYLPLSTETSFDGIGKLRVDILFNKYDLYGNLISYTALDNKVTVYLWGYSGQYPIAAIQNATYDQVKTALGVTPESLSSATTPDFTKLEALRSNSTLSKALITTYKYKPLVGMTEMTDPRGVTTYYEYDSFGRLYRTLDANKKVIQTYDYHYQNQ